MLGTYGVQCEFAGHAERQCDDVRVMTSVNLRSSAQSSAARAA